jgi:hypothetical protein
MGELLKVQRPIIEPIYSQSCPNDPILLGKERVSFTFDDVEYSDVATVVIRFLPSERLEIEFPLEGQSPQIGIELISKSKGPITLTLHERGTTVDVYAQSIANDRYAVVFVPCQSGWTVTPPSESLVSATFHLLNFPDFSGPTDYIHLTGTPPLQGGVRCGRVLLRDYQWEITIVGQKNTRSHVKSLAGAGGHLITHVGQIIRIDHTRFSSSELEDCLSCLSYFLSFALGRWAGPALPVAFDDKGQRVFEEWGLRSIADGRWNGAGSWFDQHHSELLAEVFPGFSKLWGNSTWNQPLRHSLYWFLGASDRRIGIGVDTGIILAQTALELLAWNHCVIDRQLVPRKKFRPGGLPAAEKLKLLLNDLNIPVPTLPPAATGLLPKNQGSIDGVGLIVNCRNSLIHPDSDNKMRTDAYVEAWDYSLWFIQMVLLRLCDHNGRYANRLKHRWVGMVEPVPWTRPSSQGTGSASP